RPSLITSFFVDKPRVIRTKATISNNGGVVPNQAALSQDSNIHLAAVNGASPVAIVTPNIHSNAIKNIKVNTSHHFMNTEIKIRMTAKAAESMHSLPPNITSNHAVSICHST